MGEKKPITVEEGLALEFPTPSGKVEFWSDQLAAKGFDPVPKYKSPPPAPEGYYRLVSGRAPVHTFSRTQSNALLGDLMRENELWINGATAAKLGVKGGQYVKLRNQDGVVSNRIRVKATQRIRPDTFYMVYGFGHENPMLKSAYRRGASAARAQHALRDRSADGRHEHPRQLRDHREGGLKMPRFGMVIDTRKCVGCMDCVVACQTENDVPAGYCRDWITTEVRGAFPALSMEIRSERCNHCDNPPCVSCCPTGASHVEEFGRVVQVTANRCIGCKACLAACPYGARYVHPDGYVDKCTFCTHRVKEGKDPACVSTCPTHCMFFGDLDDPKSEVSELLRTRRWHVLLPEAGTKPRVYYLT